MFTKVLIYNMFTKTKLFTYLGITIKQCANRSVNYNYFNKHYTYVYRFHLLL